jgi:hypothetical protein
VLLTRWAQVRQRHGSTQGPTGAVIRIAIDTQNEI